MPLDFASQTAPSTALEQAGGWANGRPEGVGLDPDPPGSVDTKASM